MLPLRSITCLAALATALTCSASELVLLKNGFEYRCLRHEAVTPQRMRLYTSNNNFVEVAADSIQTVTHMDDPVLQSPELQSRAQSQAQTAPIPLASEDLHQILSTAGQKHRVDADLLAAVVRAESGGHTHAVSHAGAQGLMQLMPGTSKTLGVIDAFAAEDNVNGGSKYLDQLLTRYHDNMALALAAYNAGPAAVDKYNGIPPYRETRNYVARVIREFNRRKLAQQRASVR